MGVAFARVKYVGPDEYVIVSNPITKRGRVISGPASACVAPLNRVRSGKRLALGPTQYVVVFNSLTGESRIINGPGSATIEHFMEALTPVQTKIRLEVNQCVFWHRGRENKCILGPQTVDYEFGVFSPVMNIPTPNKFQYFEVVHINGKVECINGPDSADYVRFEPQYGDRFGNLAPRVNIDQFWYVNIRYNEETICIQGPYLHRHRFGEEIDGPHRIITLLPDQCVGVKHANGEGEYLYGPKICKPRYKDVFGQIEAITRLDQDDYIIVQHNDGVKETVKGPKQYFKQYGDILSPILSATIIPDNHFIVVQNTNDNENPIQFIIGPKKYVPEPFEQIVHITDYSEYGIKSNDCIRGIEINDKQALHVLRRNGIVELVEEAQVFIPKVGEKIVKIVEKIILSKREFCIIKLHTGESLLKDGAYENARAFFLSPNDCLIEFDVGESKQSILTKYDQIIMVTTEIKMKDSLLIKVGYRIGFDFEDPAKFAERQTQIFRRLEMWVENKFLDEFNRLEYNDFVKQYTTMCESMIESANEAFQSTGIAISDIQILKYGISDPAIQSIITKQILISNEQQNKIRIKENEIATQTKDAELSQKMLEIERISSEARKRTKLKEEELNNELELKKVQADITKNEAIKRARLKEEELNHEIQKKQIEQQKLQELAELEKQNAILEMKAKQAKIDLDVTEASIHKQELEHKLKTMEQDADNELNKFFRNLPADLSKEQKLQAYELLLHKEKEVSLAQYRADGEKAFNGKIEILKMIPTGTNVSRTEYPPTVTSVINQSGFGLESGHLHQG